MQTAWPAGVRSPVGPGQTAEGRGPGLGVVQGLEPGESRPAQPTLHPRRPGNRQVGGLLWIPSPAPKGVRSWREGARPEPTGHRGAGVLGGAALARPLLLGSKQNLEEPHLAPSGPPGLDQELWGSPQQVPSPGKDRVPPRQWPNRLCLPRQGAGERVTLCRPRAIFHPYRPSVTRRPRRRTLMLHAVPAGGPKACPPPHRVSTPGRRGACGQVGGRAQSSLTRWADQSHAFLQVPGGETEAQPLGLTEATEPKKGGAQHSGQFWGSRGPSSTGEGPGVPFNRSWSLGEAVGAAEGRWEQERPGLLRDSGQGTPRGAPPCTWAPCWARSLPLPES